MAQESYNPRASSDYTKTVGDSIAATRDEIFSGDKTRREELMLDIFEHLDPDAKYKIIRHDDDDKKDVLLRNNSGSAKKGIRLGRNTEIKLIPDAIANKNERNTHGYAYKVMKDAEGTERVYVWAAAKVNDTWTEGYIAIEHIAQGSTESLPPSTTVPSESSDNVDEITIEGLKQWEHNLGEGITWKTVTTLDPLPPLQGKNIVKAAMALAVDGATAIYIVSGKDIYTLNGDEWKLAPDLEIRGPKIEKKTLETPLAPSSPPTTVSDTTSKFEKSGEFLVGKPTGRPGRVISPYPPHKELDVTGLDAGSLVLDPTTQRVFVMPASPSSPSQIPTTSEWTGKNWEQKRGEARREAGQKYNESAQEVSSLTDVEKAMVSIQEGLKIIESIKKDYNNDDDWKKDIDQLEDKFDRQLTYLTLKKTELTDIAEQSRKYNEAKTLFEANKNLENIKDDISAKTSIGTIENIILELDTVIANTNNKLGSEAIKLNTDAKKLRGEAVEIIVKLQEKITPSVLPGFGAPIPNPGMGLPRVETAHSEPVMGEWDKNKPGHILNPSDSSQSFPAQGAKPGETIFNPFDPRGRKIIVPPFQSEEKPTTAPISVGNLINQANEFYKNQNFEVAAKLYQDALQAENNNVTALIGLGITRQRQGKYADAEETLKKALEIDPTNEPASFALGVTYFKLERWKDAMDYFDKSLAKRPDNASGRHYLGIIATKLNLFDRAEREFKTALAIDPNYREAHFNLAVLYITLNPPQWDKARVEYAEAIKKGVKPDTNLEKLMNDAKTETIKLPEPFKDWETKSETEIPKNVRVFLSEKDTIWQLTDSTTGKATVIKNITEEITTLAQGNFVSAEKISETEIKVTLSGDNNFIILRKRVNDEQVPTNETRSDILAYRVDKSDTIDSIAAQFNTTVDRIREMNRLGLDGQIKIGDELVVPAMGAASLIEGNNSTKTDKNEKEKEAPTTEKHRGILAYRVDGSDTIESIATQFSTTPERIREMNKMTPGTNLKSGDEIMVPAMGAVRVGN